MSPKAGVPDTRGFRVVGWKAERIGRGSQRLIRYQIQFFAASCQLLVANCSIVKDRSHLGAAIL
jgi:hypothetical protein